MGEVHITGKGVREGCITDKGGKQLNIPDQGVRVCTSQGKG